ncbi:DNA-directed RNA polymerase V subunit 1-like [Camellia sinensis]|uniref:DNA-directed RNA polymerase V subunit 1-like n=1 Tax=Camellia sinensis TaxID=4442 RepID=UPI001035DD78|nr:DNA-directed RNA polymerase V subunit 1-like [Camellia sinensis]
MDTRFGINKEQSDSTTKAWLEKMKTLFIRKGCGFSSRSVITGDAYKGVNEIGLPFEIAQRITFEERVTQYNMQYLQKLVDEKLCLTYRDGLSTYSLREGSKGHTFLRPGQVVHRRIMDGDIVFINRPPTTHKHSLQALSVYVHDDHTVKINPLICGPLSADFDGDCVHIFYPQSLAAKSEVLELFSVEKQLLSSHSGNLNLQLATDSLLSLKILFKNYFLDRAAAQQLAMFVSNSLPQPALLKTYTSGPHWTALQILQTALPRCFDCSGERHLVCKSEILSIDFSRDVMQSIINDIVSSICFEKGPDEVLKFFNSLQPLLMENLFSEGFSVGLEDFSISRVVLENIQNGIQDISPLLYQLRLTYNELVELQLENHLRLLKVPVANFILKSSQMGNVIDSRSESAISKVVQQIGFLGLQLSDRGKFYSRSLVGEMASLFQNKHPFRAKYPSEEYGLVTNCLFHGLDPYQEMVHSISAREVIVRSSRGLTEPGTLFKNLMAILRDVVICYDDTVRNVCSNSVIQFDYGVKPGSKSAFAAGEPVGVLAATAMSNPAYKAVLDSSPSSNNSWEMMKEILLCAVNFKNVLSDRRVILYLNDCDCGRKYCRENAAYLVKNQLKKVSLKDIAVEFLIEYALSFSLHMFVMNTYYHI